MIDLVGLDFLFVVKEKSAYGPPIPKGSSANVGLSFFAGDLCPLKNIHLHPVRASSFEEILWS